MSENPADESVGQDSNTFESAVDTAAIRADAQEVKFCPHMNYQTNRCTACRNYRVAQAALALCDALDARDAEIADQRMVIAHQRDMRHAQQAEIRELRAAGKSAMDLFGGAVAKLEEIRALCDEVSPEGWKHTQMYVSDVRAILDR